MMKNPLQHFHSTLLILIAVLSNFQFSFACAESSITPVFQYKYAPENPYENFAAGRIGILKPTYRRVVLFAAYRFLNEQSFSGDEQKALVEVWNAEFRNEEPAPSRVAENLKTWLAVRKEVFPNEAATPSIYVERQNGAGYSFFPNCSAHAFETAAQTLSDRISSYGSQDVNVVEWTRAQDSVFENCAGGAKIPPAPAESFPDWLKKDREYQIAAAYFYATNFDEAKRRFSAIAEDKDSAWQPAAQYLVARTLVRQASFTENAEQRNALYDEAETRLRRLPAGDYYQAGEKLINLIKLRREPAERARELAQNLLFQQTGEQLRQDLIDYTWLLDKFETQILKAEEKRREEEEIARFAESDKGMRAAILSRLTAIGVSVEVQVVKNEVTLTGKVPEEKAGQIEMILAAFKPRKFTNNLFFVTNNPDGSISYRGGGGESFFPQLETIIKQEREAIWRGELLEVSLYGDNFRQIIVKPETSDEEIFNKLTENKTDLTEKEKQEIKTAVGEARIWQMKRKYEAKPQADYEGGYNGAEKIRFELLPDFLRTDELTDWLFTFQTQDDASYLHALEKLRETKSNLWLTAAISKAKADSKAVNEILKTAEGIEKNAPAFATVAYHRARILIEQNKAPEAAKLLDEILASTLDLPVSTRNQFTELRMKIAGTLETFLKNAPRKPFTFADYARSISIDEAIAERKSWWTKDFQQTKTEWDAESEDWFAGYKMWEKREMFDAETAAIINEHFPLASLLEAAKSPALPDYLRERLAIVIWTRAVLTEDDAVLQKIAPVVIKFAPEAEELLKAKTRTARRRAALFVIFRHADFVPFLQSGFNGAYATFNQPIGWWCETVDYDYDENGEQIPRRIPKKPSFITDEQSNAAQAEKRKIVAAGSAPAFLAREAKDWLKTAPRDPLLPEILYRAAKANENYQDTCGNTSEQAALMNLLQKNFPESDWAKKLKKESLPE